MTSIVRTFISSSGWTLFTYMVTDAIPHMSIDPTYTWGWSTGQDILSSWYFMASVWFWISAAFAVISGAMMMHESRQL